MGILLFKLHSFTEAKDKCIELKFHYTTSLFNSIPIKTAKWWCYSLNIILWSNAKRSFCYAMRLDVQSSWKQSNTLSSCNYNKTASHFAGHSFIKARYLSRIHVLSLDWREKCTKFNSFQYLHYNSPVTDGVLLIWRKIQIVTERSAYDVFLCFIRRIL